MAVTVEKLKRVKIHTQYRLKNGDRVPGVTTVLGILNKPALIHWAWDLGTQGIDYRKYRDTMADIGTLAHYMVQCDLGGDTPDLTPYSQEQICLAENCLIKFYEWRRENEIVPVLVEAALVSEQYKYGGTIDLLAYVNGVLTLVDFKTSKAVYPEMIHQLAAYNQLLAEHGFKVKNVRILRIGRSEDEGFEEQRKTMTELRNHWRIFRHCLEIYNLKKVVGGDYK